MAELRRRDFLRILGLAGTTAVAGCSSSEFTQTLIPYIFPPEDIIPGVSTWFASTCRECPAGCGLLAKNRDGRIIKVEGNPQHPVSGGKLCARGQASLHGLYNPDRYTGPIIRTERGKEEPISWEDAQKLFAQRLAQTVKDGKGKRIVFMTDLMKGTMGHLVAHWLSEMGSEEHLVYEPFAYEPLRKANEVVFGTDAIPSYRIDRADFLISFNAGFLETWLSNVEYSRQFGAFHAPRDGGRNAFVFVGPRLSMTASNADQWIAVKPGDEVLVALGMLRALLEEDLSQAIGEEQLKTLHSFVGSLSVEKISERSGVPAETLRMLAAQFIRAERPLAVAEGLSFSVPNATETAVAANLLCTLAPGTRETIDFGSPSAYGDVARAEKIKELSEKMQDGDVELLLISNTNPLFSLPASWDFRRSMQAVPFVVSFSSARDETSELAHLILPSDTPLESWGDYEPRKGVAGLMQPVMGRLFDTRHPGDILIASGKAIKGVERFPWEDFYQLVRQVWQKKGVEESPQTAAKVFWEEAMKRGGAWTPPVSATTWPAKKPSQFSFKIPDAPSEPKEGLHFVAYPTVQFFDGRGANRPWLQELPDPMAQMTWGTWMEVHLDTARELDIRDGDIVELRSPHGTIEIPAFPLPTVPRGILAIPIGQGHTRYGRFAAEAPYGNPFHLLPAKLDRNSGGILREPFGVTVKKKKRTVGMGHTDGSLTEQGRELARVMPLDQYWEGMVARRKPHLYLPLPEGYDSKKDFYPAHDHVDYRWGMVIDLDRCIGCGACVVACYAENNVAIVGKEQILKGREMSWLRVQRYFDPDRPEARWLVLPCQHCDNAPCESVCPVYAPHHSREGLNNQIYNRCIGTRFCAQNCPYKIRRFNWFTFTRPEPLNWQLNPEVTVRQKGVMEKCSFCIQRIVEAKHHAKDLGRKVKDGDFTTACAQTCPTDAIVFGNLMDHESRVSKLLSEHRAYQVLDHLNTKPAVIYLKRLRRVATSEI